MSDGTTMYTAESSEVGSGDAAGASGTRKADVIEKSGTSAVDKKVIGGNREGDSDSFHSQYSGSETPDASKLGSLSFTQALHSESDPSTVTEEAHCEDIFAVEELTLFFEWKYDVLEERCHICRINFGELCATCEEKKAEHDTCRVVAGGSCGHVFHDCCIRKWLQQKKKCPLCHREWTCALVELSSAPAPAL